MSSAVGLIQGLHTIVAMGRGPHWLLNEGELQLYGNAFKNAIRHLPIGVGQKYTDWLVLGSVIVAIDGKRVRQDIELRRRGSQTSGGAAPTSHVPPARPTGNGGAPGASYEVGTIPQGPIMPDFDA